VEKKEGGGGKRILRPTRLSDPPEPARKTKGEGGEKEEKERKEKRRGQESTCPFHHAFYSIVSSENILDHRAYSIIMGGGGRGKNRRGERGEGGGRGGKRNLTVCFSPTVAVRHQRVAARHRTGRHKGQGEKREEGGKGEGGGKGKEEKGKRFSLLVFRNHRLSSDSTSVAGRREERRREKKRKGGLTITSRRRIRVKRHRFFVVLAASGGEQRVGERGLSWFSLRRLKKLAGNGRPV